MRQPGRTNADWRTTEGNTFTWEQVLAELLMDVRTELQRLNALLHCPNFTAIPAKLDAIRRKMPAKRKASHARR